MKNNTFKLERITPDDGGFWFFGYFDKYPWDVSGRYLLANRAEFMDRQPTADDKLIVGMVDRQDNNKFIKIGETSAWCWQQGCMLQWLNDGSGTKVIYNDRIDDKFVARIVDVFTGEKQTLCHPVYCISPDGKYALSVNFSRLDKERPGYGYAGAKDIFANEKHPENDGVWLIDIKKNTTKLIISVDQIVKSFNRPEMNDNANWFNHLLFSPDSRRFAFFHRWRRPDGWQTTHMFTADIDGQNIYPLNLEDMSSHYVWFADNKIINFANQHKGGWDYYEFTDQAGIVKAVGPDMLRGSDGHCSYSLDGKWMLTDDYPTPENNNMRSLYLVNLKKNKVFVLGKFYADPSLSAPTRCDLHPNWSRDCTKVCFDSIHEGARHIYIMDVHKLTSSKAKIRSRIYRNDVALVCEN
jgi:hypothetical protein